MARPTQQQEPDFMTLGDIARRIQVGMSTAERMKAQRKLPPHIEFTSRNHRWRREDVERWIAEKLASASA